MKAIAFALVLLAMSCWQAMAQPRVRVVAESNGPALVGQPIRIHVTVLAPNFFLSPPQFPTFEIPGAIVTLLEENALNTSETIDGQVYAGIRRSYTITPQQAGDFTLPPASIPFRYVAEPGKPAVAGEVTFPPEKFSVQAPMGSEGAAAPALAAAVSIKQNFDRDLKAIRVDDALTRTVEIFAANVQAMMIPPPTFDAPPGVRVYLRDPVLSDTKTDRGEFAGGQRVDQAVYVFERPGSYTLPAIEITWYDPGSGKRRVSAAPAITVSVAKEAVSSGDLAPPSVPKDDSTADAMGRAWVWSAGLVTVALAVLFAVFRLVHPRLRTWADRRRQSWRSSEAGTFAGLKRACLANDSAAAYRALRVWARSLGGKGLYEREPVLRSEAAKLERHLFGGATPQAPYDCSRLLDAAGAARKAQAASRDNVRQTALPALNP